MRVLRGSETRADVMINEVLIPLATASVNLNLECGLSGLDCPFDFVGGTDLKIGQYGVHREGQALPYKGIAKESGT
jgi:hypothetical protein